SFFLYVLAYRSFMYSLSFSFFSDTASTPISPLSLHDALPIFKEADLTYVRDALSSIAPNLLGGELIINESTSPPGTTNEIADLLASLRPDLSTTPSLDHSVYFAHCPERAVPGRTLYELSENSRIIGGLNQESSARAAELYRTFCKGELLFTDAKTA